MNEMNREKELDLETIIDDLDRGTSLNDFISDGSTMRRKGNRKINWTPFVKVFLQLAGKRNVVLKLHRSEYRATSANGHIKKLLKEVNVDGKRLTEEEIEKYRSNFQFGKRPDYRGEALSIINDELIMKKVNDDGLTYIYIKEPLPEKLRIALYKYAIPQSK